MTRCHTLISALILFLLSAPLAAQADDLDLLNELDTAMEEEQSAATEEEDRSLAAQAARNLDLTIRLRGTHHLQTASPSAYSSGAYDASWDRQDNYGEIKVDAGSRYENDSVVLVSNGWIETGNSKDTYKGDVGLWQDKDRRRNHVEINELYLTAKGEAADLTVGRKLISNRITPGYSAADRYNAVDVNDPLDPRALGVWQVALEGETSDVSWTAAVLPVFQPPKAPSGTSRWIASNAFDGDLSAFAAAYGTTESLYSALSEELALFHAIIGQFDTGIADWIMQELQALFGYSGVSPSLTVEYDVPDPASADGTGLFGQARTTMGQFDLMASAYRGPSLYPVLSIDLDTAVPSAKLTLEHPVSDQIATGASTTWKELEFHAETLYSYSEGGKDDTYLQFVAGTVWTNNSLPQALSLHRLDLGLDYAGESIIQRQYAEGYSISSREIRLGQNDLMPGAMLHFTEDLRLHALGVYELDNGATMHRLGLQWDVTDALTTEAAVELFDGPRGSFFGHWKNQDRLVATLIYKFH